MDNLDFKEQDSYEGSEKHFLRCESFFNDEKFLRAKEEFKSWMYNAGLSSNLSKAQFYIAECEYYLQNYNQALIEYDNYLNMADQSSSLAKKAELMICRCYFNLTHNYKKDQTETKRALENLQYYIEKESLEEYNIAIKQMILELRNKLAKKDFETAKLYLRLKEYMGAEVYFSNIINEYNDTEYINISLLNVAYIKNREDNEIAEKYLIDNQIFFSSDEEFQAALVKIRDLNK